MSKRLYRVEIEHVEASVFYVEAADRGDAEQAALRSAEDASKDGYLEFHDVRDEAVGVKTIDPEAREALLRGDWGVEAERYVENVQGSPTVKEWLEGRG